MNKMLLKATKKEEGIYEVEGVRFNANTEQEAIDKWSRKPKNKRVPTQRRYKPIKKIKSMGIPVGRTEFYIKDEKCKTKHGMVTGVTSMDNQKEVWE